MATSDLKRLNESLRETERRREAARQRHGRQKRQMMIGGAVVLLAIVIVFGGMWAGARSSAVKPDLVVTWPSLPAEAIDGTNQNVASGDTLVMRQGRPFLVSVLNPSSWNLKWQSEDLETTGSVSQWDSSGATSTLQLRARRAVSGWRRLFIWLSPSQTLKLNGVASTQVDKYTQRLTPPTGGAWVYSSMRAEVPVEWDERALALLSHAGSGVTGGATWTIVPSFGAGILPGDSGTYAQLRSADIMTDMPSVARNLAAADPTMSIKFVIRLDHTPHMGIIRISLDGKGARAGWVRHPGDASGGPFTWWTTTGPADQLAPVAPGGPLGPSPTAAIQPTPQIQALKKRSKPASTKPVKLGL